MRKTTKCDDHLFPYSAQTFRFYFNRLRRELNLDIKNEHLNRGYVKFNHKFQLKGFRKLFSTKIFYEKWTYYRDSGVALEMTAKEMRHSSKHMTAYYYLCENTEELGIDRYLNVPMNKILSMNNQSQLSVFFDTGINEKFEREKQQSRLIQF